MRPGEAVARGREPLDRAAPEVPAAYFRRRRCSSGFLLCSCRPRGFSCPVALPEVITDQRAHLYEVSEIGAQLEPAIGRQRDPRGGEDRRSAGQRLNEIEAAPGDQAD